MKLSPKLVVLIGVLSVSISPILSKSAEAPAHITAFYRLLFTVLIMTALNPRRVYTDLKTLPVKDAALSWVSGFFLALHFTAWIASLSYTSVASSTVLVSMHPPIMLLAAWAMLKERPAKRQVIAVAVTVIGSALLATEDWGRGQESLFGDGLALLGALFIVFYLIIGRTVRARVSNHQYTIHTYTSCTVTLFLIGLAARTPFTGYSANDFWIFLGLAVFPTMLGHTLFNWALEYVSPTLISLSVLGEPVFAALLAMVIFSEPLGWFQGLGGVVILLGIWLYSKKSEPAQHSVKSIE